MIGATFFVASNTTRDARASITLTANSSMTSFAASNHQDICRCVGGPLHRDGLSRYGSAAGLLFRLTHDLAGEPARRALYERRPLTRQTDAGLSDDHALARTLDAPALWRKLTRPRPEPDMTQIPTAFAVMANSFEEAGHHARQGLDLAPHGTHATAARAHAKQAGRQLAVAGLNLAVASPHIQANPPLHHDHDAGYIEGEQARFAVIDGGAVGRDTAVLDACLRACAALDRAVHAGDAHALRVVMDTLFEIAVDYPNAVLSFCDDVPMVGTLSQAATDWLAARNAYDAARAEAAARQAAWEASLPSAAELMRAVAAEANGEGTSFDSEGSTLWHEPTHGGWSLTNAYGVDHCRFLASERDFEQLIDAVRHGQDIGPAPPGCEARDEPVEDDSDIARCTRATRRRWRCWPGSGSRSTRRRLSSANARVSLFFTRR